MNRLPMSTAAAALLRALLLRGNVPRDRILLSEIHSTDWQSLTFVGERHEIHFTIRGEDSRVIVDRLIDGLEDAEFAITGQIVADIGFRTAPPASDGSVGVSIEALTIAE